MFPCSSVWGIFCPNTVYFPCCLYPESLRRAGATLTLSWLVDQGFLQVPGSQDPPAHGKSVGGSELRVQWRREASQAWRGDRTRRNGGRRRRQSRWLSHFHRECVITASLTQTSLQMRREWENVILVSVFWLIPCGVSFWALALCAPRPLARDRGAGRSEFRLPLEESHQEELKGSVWAPGAWGFRTRRWYQGHGQRGFQDRVVGSAAQLGLGWAILGLCSFTEAWADVFQALFHGPAANTGVHFGGGLPACAQPQGRGIVPWNRTLLGSVQSWEKVFPARPGVPLCPAACGLWHRGARPCALPRWKASPICVWKSDSVIINQGGPPQVPQPPPSPASSQWRVTVLGGVRLGGKST